MGMKIRLEVDTPCSVEFYELWYEKGRLQSVQDCNGKMLTVCYSMRGDGMVVERSVFGSPQVSGPMAFVKEANFFVPYYLYAGIPAGLQEKQV